MRRRTAALLLCVALSGCASGDLGAVAPSASQRGIANGVAEAYETLLPALREAGVVPWSLTEEMDDDQGTYEVLAGGRRYSIYEHLDDRTSWAKAPYALFSIVNQQLAEKTDLRLFAINGGNDLYGMLLTEAEAVLARKPLSNKEDWPYLPTMTPPRYGMHK